MISDVSTFFLTEEPAELSGAVIWRCTCDTAPLGALNYTPASNCSSSCDCEPGTSLIYIIYIKFFEKLLQ